MRSAVAVTCLAALFSLLSGSAAAAGDQYVTIDYPSNGDTFDPDVAQISVQGTATAPGMTLIISAQGTGGDIGTNDVNIYINEEPPPA